MQQACQVVSHCIIRIFIEKKTIDCGYRKNIDILIDQMIICYYFDNYCHAKKGRKTLPAEGGTKKRHANQAA
ncbi:hypothetical protein A3196_03615 [Candidatus Thiodiazotropha endoloripes]|uniref:Uncharacterized protein n=1 Tax=Candidatus Thiodiazotropha endoloripes TaxID=1818881 RepID=A0A1E2UN12_9GAMM|nr:hypothetical protein A3196_03615 [Candidatus Thiodiazotropha endoloripes]